MASSRKRKMTTQRATTKPLLRLLLRPLGKRSLSLSLSLFFSLVLPAVLPPRSFHSVLLPLSLPSRLVPSRERQAKCSSRFVNPTFRNVFDASDWLKNAKAYAQKAGPLNRRRPSPLRKRSNDDCQAALKSVKADRLSSWKRHGRSIALNSP